MTDTWFSIQLFSKGIEHLKKHLEDVSAFEKHLLKTHCSDLMSLILRQVAADNHMGVSIEDISQGLDNEERIRIINSISRNKVGQLFKANETLKGKSLDDFMNCIDEAAASCEFILKKLDKKLERQLVFNHRHAVMEKLKNEVDPALALHLASILLFQFSCKAMIHAPGRCVPQLIQFLSKDNPETCIENEEEHEELLQYQNLVMQSIQLSAKGEPEEEEEEALDGVRIRLEEQLPRIKEIAFRGKGETA